MAVPIKCEVNVTNAGPVYQFMVDNKHGISHRNPMVAVLRTHTYLLRKEATTRREEGAWHAIWDSLSENEKKLCSKLKKLNDDVINKREPEKKPMFTRMDLEKVREFKRKMGEGKRCPHVRSASWRLGEIFVRGTAVRKDELEPDVSRAFTEYMDLYNDKMAKITGKKPINFWEFAEMVESKS